MFIFTYSALLSQSQNGICWKSTTISRVRKGREMHLKDTQLHCQIPCLDHVADGIADVPPMSVSRRFKLMARRSLGPARERSFKNNTNKMMNRVCELTGRNTKPPAPVPRSPEPKLKAGDLVRVRSLEEIEATLNHWRQLKGLSYMPEMARYSGTTQRVLKRMERFVDERDLMVKKSPGIILLEGVMCEGTAEFGGCDRCCFHFWREEWLERIDDGNTGVKSANGAGAGNGTRSGND
jgi:hypothetical protein